MGRRRARRAAAGAARPGRHRPAGGGPAHAHQDPDRPVGARHACVGHDHDGSPERTSVIGSPGASMAVDWEQRVDFARLRSDRFARTRAALEASDLGALLLYDQNNIRYVTSTHIGEWARDKSARYALVPREGDPVLWDFGSAARHHQLYAPWFPESSWQAGVSPIRGAMPAETGVPALMASHVHETLRDRGLELGDAAPVMQSARRIKTVDEIALLDHAAAIVDAVYDLIYRTLRPGLRENQVVAEAHRLLFELGSEQVEAINAVSGERCSPHPHVFSDRLLRPGVTTDRIAAVWPTAQELGFKDEEACFGLQFGHGLGVGLYEAPMISRLHSFDAPVEIEVGMVFALETYCPARNGGGAARTEEEVAVPRYGT